jgi:hypothetical protein
MDRPVSGILQRLHTRREDPTSEERQALLREFYERDNDREKRYLNGTGMEHYDEQTAREMLAEAIARTKHAGLHAERPYHSAERKQRLNANKLNSLNSTSLERGPDMVLFDPNRRFMAQTHSPGQLGYYDNSASRMIHVGVPDTLDMPGKSIEDELPETVATWAHEAQHALDDEAGDLAYDTTIPWERRQPEHRAVARGMAHRYRVNDIRVPDKYKPDSDIQEVAYNLIDIFSTLQQNRQDVHPGIYKYLSEPYNFKTNGKKDYDLWMQAMKDFLDKFYQYREEGPLPRVPSDERVKNVIPSFEVDE